MDGLAFHSLGDGTNLKGQCRDFQALNLQFDFPSADKRSKVEIMFPWLCHDSGLKSWVKFSRLNHSLLIPWKSKTRLTVNKIKCDYSWRFWIIEIKTAAMAPLLNSRRYKSLQKVNRHQGMLNRHAEARETDVHNASSIHNQQKAHASRN